MPGIASGLKVVSWVTFLLGAAPACSLLIVDGPPPAEARRGIDFACTTSHVLPVADLIAAAAVAVHEFGDVGTPDRAWTGLALSPDHQRFLAAGLMTTFTASAVVGFERVRSCREASAEQEMRQRRERSGGVPAAGAPPTPSRQ